MSFDPIFTLAMTTLGTVLAGTLFQLVSVRRDLEQGARSAMARRRRNGRTRI